MNFVFISPQFPRTYWNFCDRLNRNGVTVLGIGDTPYDELPIELKNSLTEYYRLDTLEDYDQMLRAIGFFTFKYGKIDWIESNNEYWLEQDARLRTDFHVTTGVQADEVRRFKSKSGMKAYYREAGVPTARCHKVTTIEAANTFLVEVGYPVIVKPDVGVGATDTWRLDGEQDLENFFANLPKAPYVMEEFIEGDICSYDAITDAECAPLFESMTVWPPSIMDIVLEQRDLSYYVAAQMPDSLRRLGRATVKAFDAKSRFVHMEFFRLTKARKGLGEVGDFVGLEVNMRPAGGYTPDMMNYAHSTDVYQIWADMVSANQRLLPERGEDHFCVYASQRDCFTYRHSHREILDRYGEQIVMCERMPEMNVAQMGNQMYTAHASTLEETEEFIRFVIDRA
ncbi:MAG: carbamoylphosphate synthase large subunit [Clostridiales bacterium]|nr:carbamoylphosphate synthase large subunit [Clostridiales bacterium]